MKSFTLVLFCLLVSIASKGQKIDNSHLNFKIIDSFDNSTKIKKIPAPKSQYNLPHTYKLSKGNKLQFLDSVKYNSKVPYISDAKGIYTYNAKGLVNLTVDYSWDDYSNEWEGEEKVEYTYNQSGNLIGIIASEWDYNNRKWIIQYYTSYNYDKANNITSNLFYSWDEVKSKFIAYAKIEYTYNTQGENTMYMNSYLDKNTNKWQPSSKTEYSYNAKSKPILIENYNWEDNKWQSTTKEEYSYDSNGNIILYKQSEWDESSEVWMNIRKYENSFDAHQNTTLFLSFNWIESDNTWIPSQRIEYDYNENGNLILSITYNWNKTISQLVNYIKNEYQYGTNQKLSSYTQYSWEFTKWEPLENETYSYDQNNNTIDITYNKWDANTSQLVPDYRNEFTYNLEYDSEDMVIPPKVIFKLSDLDYVNIPISITSFTYQDTNWLEEGEQILYYSKGNSIGFSETTELINNLYPNPVSNNLTIRFSDNSAVANFELYDTQGRKVWSKHVSNNESISLENLNKGIYFYKLLSGDKVSTGKLIKE